MSIDIEIFSDVICPWCFIGRRRLEKALEEEKDRVEANVRWMPFELNPTMPAGGLDRREYRSAKFGSWEKSLALDAQVASVGAAEGITFHFEKIRRTPNTFDAHRLIWLAGREGVQDLVVEAIFRQYFCEGSDVGDRQVLADIAWECGLDAAEVVRFLGSDGAVEEVRHEEERARRMNITAVPAFVINGRYLVSGAQTPATFAAAFDRAMKEMPA